MADPARGADERTIQWTQCMPRFLLSDSDVENVAALGEALDLIDLGVAVLDRDLRARIVNRRFAELWPLPAAGAVPTLRELTRVVHDFQPQGSPADLAHAASQLEASVSAGAIPAAEITMADGTRRLLRCMVRRDGGRVLTCSEILWPGNAAEPSPPTQAADQRLAIELRFSNETLESQASYLASLAEAADANAQAAEEAKRQLQHEVEERRQLEGRLRHMATTDALTGVLNRAQFLALGEREVERVRQHGLGLALLMLDIDHFKLVNDRYGHPVGDAALCHLVAGLRAGTRRIDLLGRLGGEEFAIVLPAIGREAGGAVAERLRRHVASHPLIHDAQQIGMTVSIGLAMLSDGDRGMEQLLVRADALLYEAKDGGRDRVVSEAAMIAV